MAQFKQLAKDTLVRNLVTEFVASQSTSKKLLSEIYSGLDKKQNLYYAIQLGEQTAHDIQVDILCEYLNEHPVLKEDIFQRGLARAKSYMTTPLGKGFGDAKNQQMVQNLFGTLKKNTEKIVGGGPSPFTPTAEDQKTNPVNIDKVGALIGKRFANLSKNPKLSAPPTPAEVQAGMGHIQQLIDKLRSTGLVKGADNILDELGIFARQHPTLSNMIVGGLVSVMALSSGGGALVAIPLLKKFLIGTALRTLLGMVKGETPAQAAAKGAMVSGSGIAVGKLLGMFYDQIAGWLGGADPGGAALPGPASPAADYSIGDDPASGVTGTTDPSQAAGTDVPYSEPVPDPEAEYSIGDTPATGETGDASSMAGTDVPATGDDAVTSAAPVAPVDGEGPGAYPFATTDPAQASLDAQPTGEYPLAGTDPNNVSALAANQGLPGGGAAAAAMAPTSVNMAALQPKISALNALRDFSDIKGAEQQTGIPQRAINGWLNNVTTPAEAQALLANPNVANQMMRKGVTGALKKKFGLQERAVSKQQAEIDYLKAELKADGTGLAIISEANPLTAAKNFMFGGPKVGGKNARLDYKQVESDYLKFLNNMESQLGMKTEKDILDFFKTKDKVFPGVYPYLTKVRSWLYGATPEASKPLPEPLTVPPTETPTPANPNPSPTAPTDPKTIPVDPPKDPNPATPPPGTPPAALPGGKTPLDANKIKTVKVFLSRMIDLGELLNRTNPTTLTKPVLRDLATNIYTLGDVVVNKKTDGKVNPIVDKATQGLDLLGSPTASAPAAAPAPAPKPAGTAPAGMPIRKERKERDEDQEEPNVFKEAGAPAPAGATGYSNPELSKQLATLKADTVFKNLPQRLQTLMAAKATDAKGLVALKVFLNSVYNSIVKSSAGFQQSVGNPAAIKKELEADKDFLKEVTSNEIMTFNTELTKAMTDIIAVAGSLRQVFNRKNPKNIYNTAVSAGKAEKPAEKKAEKPADGPTDTSKTLGAAIKATRPEAEPEPKRKAWGEGFSLSDYRKFF